MSRSGTYNLSEIEKRDSLIIDLAKALQAVLDCWGYGDRPQGGDSEETMAVLMAREALGRLDE